MTLKLLRACFDILWLMDEVWIEVHWSAQSIGMLDSKVNRRWLPIQRHPQGLADFRQQNATIGKNSDL